MKLDIATLEGFLMAEKGISKILPPSSLSNCSSIKERISQLDNENLADLCRWIQCLRDSARVLRSLSFDLNAD